jgi:hypothetical protein
MRSAKILWIFALASCLDQRKLLHMGDERNGRNSLGLFAQGIVVAILAAAIDRIRCRLGSSNLRIQLVRTILRVERKCDVGVSKVDFAELLMSGPRKNNRFAAKLLRRRARICDCGRQSQHDDNRERL